MIKWIIIFFNEIYDINYDYYWQSNDDYLLTRWCSLYAWMSAIGRSCPMYYIAVWMCVLLLVVLFLSFFLSFSLSFYAVHTIRITEERAATTNVHARIHTHNGTLLLPLLLFVRLSPVAFFLLLLLLVLVLFSNFPFTDVQRMKINTCEHLR